MQSLLTHNLLHATLFTRLPRRKPNPLPQEEASLPSVRGHADSHQQPLSAQSVVPEPYLSLGPQDQAIMPS